MLKLVPLLVWPLIAAGFSFWLKADILATILIFFGLPSIYLSFFKPNFIVKSLVFSAVTAVPFGIIFDYIMQATRGWAIAAKSIPFKLFTYVSAEQIIWLFFFAYFVVIFYETFIDSAHKPELLPPKGRYMILILAIIFGAFIVFFFVKPSLLKINFFYSKGGFVFVVIPLIIAILSRKTKWRNFMLVGLYFLYLSLIYQLTALSLNLWKYPAAEQFIAHINIAGFTFPIEELIFWIVLGAPGILAWYVYFYDST